MNIDLTQFDDQFAKAEIKENIYKDLPDGKYVVSVERVELTTTKTSGKPMVTWELRVLKGNGVGRMIWKNTVICPTTIGYIKQDLAKLGLNIRKLSQLNSNLENLLDKVVNITKKTNKSTKDGKEYSNVYFNKVICSPVLEKESVSFETHEPVSNQDPFDQEIPF